MNDFLNKSFLNNTMLNYLLFLLTLVLGILIVFVIKHIVIKRLITKAKKTKEGKDDFLIEQANKKLVPVLYFGIFYLSIRFLNIGSAVQRVINFIILGFVFVFCAVFLSTVLVFIFKFYGKQKNKNYDPMVIKWVSNFIKSIVWIVALLLFLDNIGIKITTLVAGLGIGGIAIAFAAQAIIADIFSFITIFFDRPFEIGDNIAIDNLSGTVENIGIRTTRVRSKSGEELVFSNKDLTGARLKNYKRMQKRRVEFIIGVAQNTPLDKLKAIPRIIKNIFSEIKEDVTLDMIHLSEISNSSFIFEVVYYVNCQDFSVYMNAQQEINLKILEHFGKNEIGFALTVKPK